MFTAGMNNRDYKHKIYISEQMSTRESKKCTACTNMCVCWLYVTIVNIMFLNKLMFCFSLLSGGGDGIIAIHDLHNTAGIPQCTFPAVCTVGLSNRCRHKFSVETVTWYPLDTGLFISSGTDKVLKVWDTNSLTVNIKLNARQI